MKSRRSFVAVNGAWAGLGNRIRFTLSAEAIAEAAGRDFAYVWPTSPGLFEPQLTDLWDYSAPQLPSGSVVPEASSVVDRESEWVVDGVAVSVT